MPSISFDQNPNLIKREFEVKKDIPLTIVVITSVAVTAIMALSTVGIIAIAISLTAKITIGLIGVSVSFIFTLFLLSKGTRINQSNLILSDDPNQTLNNSENLIFPDDSDPILKIDSENIFFEIYDDESYSDKEDYNYSLFSDDCDNQIKHVQNERKAQENSSTTSIQNYLFCNEQNNIKNYIEQAQQLIESSAKIKDSEKTSWEFCTYKIEMGEEPFSTLTTLESGFTDSVQIQLNIFRQQYNLLPINAEPLVEEYDDFSYEDY